jgi:hypothetical protein
MKNLKIKIITGYRKDQFYTIDSDEAHKAYYLFLHPEERGVFKNGVALVGSNIQGIEPDYNATMGWNADHELQGEDYNEIRQKKIDRDIREVLIFARNVAENNSDMLDKPLSEIKLLN